jgi:hypothetical protein
MKSQWALQFAVTRERLPMLLGQSSSDAEDFSVSERALYTACGFWSAVEAGTLSQLLGADVAEELRYVSIVYAAIGAVQVSQVLDETLAALNQHGSASRQMRCITLLQKRLRQADDPLIDLVARLTQPVH